jgi:hypothetical protein
MTEMIARDDRLDKAVEIFPIIELTGETVIRV